MGMVCLQLSGTGGATELDYDVTVTLSTTNGKAGMYINIYGHQGCFIETNVFMNILCTLKHV